MSSWFSNIASQATSLADKVKESMPTIDNATLQKLTLTTPELQEARQKIIEEERRKESVRDRLAGMLPWETRDPERDILVDECREAILKLSASKETFTGPWKMPPKGIKVAKKKSKDEDENEQDGDDEDEFEEEQEDVPSKESLDQLSKLEPLPALLGDFDLDSHVGLIQRLLKEDAQLVSMQSTLSGGGERERIFWKNFFFHCAFARYEAGLSIDEIWSEEPVVVSGSIASSAQNEEATSATGTEEETIVFESNEASPPAETTKAPTDTEGGWEAGSSAAGKSEPKVSRQSSDFDMMDDLDDIGGNGKDKEEADEEGDYELDELEAEIARELED